MKSLRFLIILLLLLVNVIGIFMIREVKNA